jgi:hypothetical protein
MFVEKFVRRSGRGSIAVIPIGPNGDPGPAISVLERPYHLSYPCVNRWRGTWYMIPETGSQGTVELYACDRFPDRWHFEQVLLRGAEPSDATLFEHDGRLWMFVCFATLGSSDTELSLFHSEDIRGPWHPHPLNPVVSDARCARPAGALWTEAGRLFRPAQVCAPRYGRAVAFQHVIRLTLDDYAEETIGVLSVDSLPGAVGAQGAHTWARGSRLVAMDVLR